VVIVYTITVEFQEQKHTFPSMNKQFLPTSKE